jgi:hypothetical protein
VSIVALPTVEIASNLAVIVAPETVEPGTNFKPDTVSVEPETIPEEPVVTNYTESDVG